VRVPKANPLVMWFVAAPQSAPAITAIASQGRASIRERGLGKLAVTSAAPAMQRLATARSSPTCRRSSATVAKPRMETRIRKTPIPSNQWCVWRGCTAPCGSASSLACSSCFTRGAGKEPGQPTRGAASSQSRATGLTVDRQPGAAGVAMSRRRAAGPRRRRSEGRTSVGVARES